MREVPGQRMAGLLLGLWFIVHQWLVVLPEMLASALGLLFVIGLALRLAGCLPPTWVGWVVLAGAVPAPVFSGASLTGGAAGAAAWAAGALLLQPMTPRRVLRALLAAVAVLAVIALGTDIGSVPLILDVAILLFIAQQSHTPEEATRSLRAVLLRALRLVVPVAAVVVPAFWIFPAISQRTEVSLAGFSGELNAGDFSGIRPSRQSAFVARFPEGAAVPGVGDLFWRGSVLDDNHGFRWLAGEARAEPAGLDGPPAWRYALTVEPMRPVAPLGMAKGLEGRFAPEDECLNLEVASYDLPATDPPRATDLGLPHKIANDPVLRDLQQRIFRGPGGTRRRLAELGEFFADGGFTYTIRPGRVDSLAVFLAESRRGFCEHYAAASANLLRLAGVPARVVTGYRGGRWNPWLRTLSVRDSDAHAWVEAWDPSTAVWVRFDATEAVAPDFLLQLATDREPGRWTWPRTALTYVGSLFVRVGGLVEPMRLPLVAALLAGVAGAVLFGMRRRMRGDPLRSALEAMDRCAARLGAPRAAGETPLAWVERAASACPSAASLLDRFAACYEESAYESGGDLPACQARLRQAAAALRQIPAPAGQRRPSTPT